MRLRPRDMAIIGRLVLAGGRWNDRQVVSKAWIDASTTPRTKASSNYSYGYLWWLRPLFVQWARGPLAGRARTGRAVDPHRPRGPARSRHHLRPRHHRDRRESHQAGRVRFSRKAADHRQGHGGAQQRGAAAPAGTGTEPPEGIGRRQAAHHRRERAHEGAAPAAGADGRHQRPRADFRRERHRQGTDRARDSRRQPARRRSLRRSELRRDPGRADRKRVVRPPQGQPGGRARRQDRQTAEGRRRNAVSGRSRRHVAQDPGQGAARARRAALRAGGRRGIDSGGRARGGFHQQESGRGNRARQLPRGSVLPPERGPVPRAAAARAHRGRARCWPIIFCGNSPPPTAASPSS